MKPPTPIASPVRPLLSLLLASSSLVALRAQQAAPPSATTTEPSTTETAKPVAAESKPAEEEIVLNPFIVDASADKGYLVGNTLSGSRLRTDLTDVAASVSVMNAEFLRDIGARNMQDALRYEVNSENENEVVYNDTEGTITGDGTSNRVRGLINAQVTRDFFNTYVATDTYNTDRFTVSRGPNAILFGIGSPSGSIDANLKTARFKGMSGSVGATFDQYGTRRYELDYNLPLFSQWALRVDYLNQDKRSFMKPEYDKEQRKFITTTFKPLEHTTFTANFEDIHNNRVHARRNTAYDGVSSWIAAGKPLYDNFSGQWVNSSGNPVTFNGGLIGNSQRTYFFDNNKELSSNAWSGITLNTADQSLATHGNQGQYSNGKMARSYSGVGSRLLGFNNEELYPSNLNYAGLAAKAKINAQILNARFQQQIAHSLNLDLSYNREKYQNDSNEYVRGNFAILQADVNKYLVLHNASGGLLKDASGNLVKILNPNAGRYMIGSSDDVGSGDIGFDRGYTTNSYRATLSYDLDLTHTSKWLGHHQFAVMYQHDDMDSHTIKTRTKSIGDQLIGSSVIDSKDNITEFAYLDLPGDSDGSGVHTPGAWASPSDKGLAWWKTVSGPLQEVAIHNKTTSDAELAVLNSRFDHIFAKDSLVFIAGIRRDNQKVYDANLKLGDQYLDYTTGVTDWKRAPIPTTPSQNDTGNTSTVSAVYHTPLTGLSVSYSRSNNFTPQSKYRDFEDRPQTAAKGRSDEWGISYDSPNQKFHARLVRFDASAVNQKEDDWFYWAPAWMAIYYMDYQVQDYVKNIYGPRGVDRTADLVGMFDVVNQTDRQVPFRDRKSKGYELELIAQPLPNLNLRFTASKSDAVDSHIATDMINYINKRLPVWERYADLTASWNRGWSTDPWYDDPRNLYWGDDNAGRKNIYSVGYTPYNDPEGLIRVEDLKALEGAATLRSRATTMNLTANYTFTNGILKGLNVGGGVRYRDPAAIGYLGKVSTNTALPAGTIVSDLSKPVFGDALLNVDLWAGYTRPLRISGHKIDWSIYLYAWNANTGRGLQPGAVNFQGQVTRWIIKDPATVSLTNTFSF